MSYDADTKEALDFYEATLGKPYNSHLELNEIIDAYELETFEEFPMDIIEAEELPND